MKSKFLFLSFLSLFFSFFFFSPAFAEDYKLFTETDEFKMYGRNEIYIYEPCENRNSDGSGSSDGSIPRTLEVGGNSLDEKLYSASRIFGKNAVAIGITRAIHSLNHDSFPYFYPSSESETILNTAKSDEKFADYLTKLNENDESALIAAEFYYLYKNTSVDFASALGTETASNAADATAVGKKFLETIGSPNNSFSVSEDEYNTLASLSISEESITIRITLTSVSTTEYTSSTYIVGDSLTHHANASICDNKDTFCDVISTETKIDNDHILAEDGRTFEKGIDKLLEQSPAGIKYLLLELGNNNCASGCESGEFTYDYLKEKIEELQLKFSDETDGAPIILLVLGYRSYNGGTTFEEPFYNELYRQLINDTEFNKDGKIMLVDGWLTAVKEDSSLVQNIGHPTEKGAKKLAEIYKSALISAQSKLQNLRDTRPCDRAAISRRQERESEPEIGDDNPCFDNPDDPACDGDLPDDPSTPSDASTPSDPSDPSTPSAHDFTQEYTGTMYTQSGNSKKWKGGTTPTIKESGCPLVAAANALTALGKTSATPNHLADLSMQHLSGGCDRSLFDCGAADWSNSGLNNIKWFLNKYSVSIQSINKSQVDNYMKNGYVIIVNGQRNKNTYPSSYCNSNRTSKNCIFGGSGHYITLMGKIGNNYQVANPANGGNRTISLSDIEAGSSNRNTKYYAIK